MCQQQTANPMQRTFLCILSASTSLRTSVLINWNIFVYYMRCVVCDEFISHNMCRCLPFATTNPSIEKNGMNKQRDHLQWKRWKKPRSSRRIETSSHWYSRERVYCIARPTSSNVLFAFSWPGTSETETKLSLRLCMEWEAWWRQRQQRQQRLVAMQACKEYIHFGICALTPEIPW